MAKDDDDFDTSIDDETTDAPEDVDEDDDDEDKGTSKTDDKAVRAARAARKERNEARRQLAELKREVAELRAGGSKDDKKDDAARDREADERAHTRYRPVLVKAEAKGALVQAGAKPDRVARLVRLLDVDEISVDEKGNVDEDDLQAEVDRIKEEWPELFKSDDDSDDKPTKRRAPAGGRRDGAARGGKAPTGPSSSTVKLARMLTGSK